MKKYKYLLLTFLIPLLIPITAYAECTKEDIEHFKEIEDEYTITYELDKETNLYTIILNNPDSANYEYAFENSDIVNNCSSIGNGKTNCNNITSGEYKITIVGIKENCYDTLKKITLNLVTYNNYSEDPLCNGLEEFYLCQPTYDKSIDYDTFVARVKLYKEKQEEKKQNEQQKEETQKESKILKYIKDNLIQIIVIAVFIIMIVITIILTIKSAKQSRRLE